MTRKPHAEPAYDRDLDRIRGLVTDMFEVVERMLDDSLGCVASRDGGRAAQVAARDGEVNALEVEIDERCLELLARWQPVASDLRFVGATLKLVTDLERVGDHCVHLCERIADLPAAPAEPPAALDALLVAVPALLREACAAWRSEDTQTAGRVIERAALTHALLREVVRDCLGPSPRAATPVAAALCWHEVATSLDRIAGHAANVGEMVIFLVRGQDVRHLRLSG